MSTKKVLKGPSEKEKIEALIQAKNSFKLLYDKAGFSLASWAFRKVLEANSKQKQLLKRKEELEKELKEIGTQL